MTSPAPASDAPRTAADTENRVPAPPEPFASPLRARVYGGVALLALITVGAALRLLAAGGELWLDEIWTCVLVVRSVESPFDVLFRIHDENNHYLNTLCVWAIGPLSTSLELRFPAILCGLAAIALAARSARRAGADLPRAGAPVDAAGLVAALLFAVSYPVVHYTSEARGYAFLPPVALAGLAALEHVGRPAGRALRWVGLWWLTSVAGFLAQPVFAAFWLAAALWSVRVLQTLRLRWDRAAAQLLIWHAVPAAGMTAVYFVNLRFAQNLGGPQTKFVDVAFQTLSLSVGGALAGDGLAVAALFAVGLTVAGLVLRFVRGDERWIRDLLIVVVVPAAMVLMLERLEIYPRYFFVPVTVLLLLWAELLAEGLRAGGAWRVGAGALLIAFVGLNLVHDLRLIRQGRGGYVAALNLIRDQSPPEGEIRYARDHEFRNDMIVFYYQNRLDGRMRPVRVDDRPPPDWLLTHSIDGTPPPGVLTFPPLVFERVYRHRVEGLSGWDVALYRRR